MGNSNRKITNLFISSQQNCCDSRTRLLGNEFSLSYYAVMFAGRIRLDLTRIKWKLQFVSKGSASLFLVVMATSLWETLYNAPFHDIAKLPIRQVWTLFGLYAMRCKVSEILKHLASQITTYKCSRFCPPLICPGALHLCLFESRLTMTRFIA